MTSRRRSTSTATSTAMSTAMSTPPVSDGSTDATSRDDQPRWLTATELGAWQGLMFMSAQLSTRLNRQLQEDQGISLADYEVLGRLRGAAQQRLRIGELGESLAWEQSRLSHQLSRMEKRGLVAKESCLEDRRGASVVLTDAGRAAIEAAAPGHVEAVRALLLDRLRPEQVRELAQLTETVIAALESER